MRNYISLHTAKYAATFIARPHKTLVNHRELDEYLRRQRFHRRFTEFGHSWPGKRRRYRGWLPKEPV